MFADALQEVGVVVDGPRTVEVSRLRVLLQVEVCESHGVVGRDRQRQRFEVGDSLMGSGSQGVGNSNAFVIRMKTKRGKYF